MNARLHPPDSIHYYLFRSLLLLSYLYFLWIRLSFADLVSGAQTIFCQALNCSKTVSDMYIRQVRSSRVTCQDFSHLANTLANTNGLLVSNLCHLANTLTNTNDRANNFIKENDNLTPQQVDDVNRYHSRIFFLLIHRCPANPIA